MNTLLPNPVLPATFSTRNFAQGVRGTVEPHKLDQDGATPSPAPTLALTGGEAFLQSAPSSGTSLAPAPVIPNFISISPAPGPVARRAAAVQQAISKDLGLRPDACAPGPAGGPGPGESKFPRLQALRKFYFRCELVLAPHSTLPVREDLWLGATGRTEARAAEAVRRRFHRQMRTPHRLALRECTRIEPFARWFALHELRCGRPQKARALYFQPLFAA